MERQSGLEGIAALAMKGLVGKFSYDAMHPKDIDQWVSHHWAKLVGYRPEIYILSKGWYLFYFRIDCHTNIILNQTWIRGNGSLILKRWHMGFNPVSEKIWFRHIWVLLPDFPLEMWHREGFTAVENHLGRFLHINEGTLNGMDRQVGQVLVDIDMSLGIFDSLDIVWRNRRYSQLLDYWGVPFHCSRCKAVGHLWRECSGSSSGSDLDSSEDVLAWSSDSSFDSGGDENGHAPSSLHPSVKAVALYTPSSIIGKLSRLDPNISSSLSSADVAFFSKLESKGDHIGEGIIGGPSSFYLGVPPSPHPEPSLPLSHVDPSTVPGEVGALGMMDSFSFRVPMDTNVAMGGVPAEASRSGTSITNPESSILVLDPALGPSAVLSTSEGNTLADDSLVGSGTLSFADVVKEKTPLTTFIENIPSGGRLLDPPIPSLGDVSAMGLEIRGENRGGLLSSLLSKPGVRGKIPPKFRIILHRIYHWFLHPPRVHLDPKRALRDYKALARGKR